MKRSVFAIIFLTLAFTVAEAGRHSFPANGKAVTVSSGTYVNSQVDTIIIMREAGLVGVSLSLSPTDSMNLHTTTAGKVGRWFNNALLPYVAADTLTNFTAYKLAVAATADTCIASGITISSATQPMPEYFIILVTYASSGNGTHVGTTPTTPTIYYTVSKQFYK